MQGWLDASGSRSGSSACVGVVRRLLFPCFFCSLTTALGFGSLLASDMPAVQQFGAFAALGVAISFAVGMTLVPVGLTFLAPPRRSRAARRNTASCAPRARLGRAAARPNIPWRVLAVSARSPRVGVVGVPPMRNNTDLVRFLKPDAPLYRDTMFIDAHLTGANTLEFVVMRAGTARR